MYYADNSGFLNNFRFSKGEKSGSGFYKSLETLPEKVGIFSHSHKGRECDLDITKSLKNIFSKAAQKCPVARPPKS